MSNEVVAGRLPRSASLVSSSARQDRPAIRSASEIASSRTLSAGWTASTRPAASACSALSTSPAYSIRRAVCSPAVCGSRQFAPAPAMMPSPSSGWANLACGEAIRRSQARASSQPPPYAGPSMTAMLGHRCASSRSNRPALMPRSAASASRSTISAMSAPAANTPGVVECTISTHGSRRACASAASIWSTIAWSRALCLPGRFRPSRKTLPLRSVLTRSAPSAAVPPCDAAVTGRSPRSPCR